MFASGRYPASNVEASGVDGDIPQSTIDVEHIIQRPFVQSEAGITPNDRWEKVQRALGIRAVVTGAVKFISVGSGETCDYPQVRLAIDSTFIELRKTLCSDVVILCRAERLERKQCRGCDMQDQDVSQIQEDREHSDERSRDRLLMPYVKHG
jgi:hypothetical protein